MGESAFLVALLALNLVAGLGLAVPLSAVMASLQGSAHPRRQWFVVLVGVYFVEGIAIGFGMTIPVFSVALAFVWGVVLWVRLAGAVDRRTVLRATALFSLYSSLPAVSFLAVPVAVALGGGSIVTVEAGVAFGIPELPGLLSPLSTILGFYLATEGGALLLKAVITTGEVSVLMHIHGRREG